MKYYIVLFKDGVMEIFNRNPGRKAFRDDAKIYSCNEDTTVVDVSEWIGSNYIYDRKIKLVKD